MKNLLFPNIYRDYAGFEGFIPVNVGTSWLGIAKVEDEKAKEILDLKLGVEELNDSQYDSIKKKVEQSGTAYRNFQTVRQESDRHPNAQPAQEAPIKEDSGSQSPKKGDNPKDLIRVDAVDAEVEAVEKPAPKPKAKKGKK